MTTVPPITLSIEQQQRLVDMVERTAKFYARGHPSQVDEYYSAGLVGLGEAINTFDLARGAKLETFASHCVRSRIRDAVRDEFRTGTANHDPDRDHEVWPHQEESKRKHRTCRNRIRATITSLDAYEENMGPVADPNGERDQEEPGDVRRYFVCLTQDQRRIFEFIYLRGMTPQQVGKRMRKAVGAVRQAHESGLRRMRNYLSDSSWTRDLIHR